MHQSQLSFVAPLSSLHSHSQSKLGFDRSVSILWSYPFCLCSAKQSLIWLSLRQMLPVLLWPKKRKKHKLIRHKAGCVVNLLSIHSAPYCTKGGVKCNLQIQFQHLKHGLLCVWCQLHTLILHPRETPIRGLMGRIERSPAIGASCYLLTAATHLAGPLFLRNCVHMCGSAEVHMCPCVWTEDLCLYANACLTVHVCACDIGRVDVNIWEKSTKTVVCGGTKDGGLTLNMWLYGRSGHGCGYNT